MSDEQRRPPADGDRDAGSDAEREPENERESESDGERQSSDAHSRHDRLTRHPAPGPRNSLWNWPDAKHPLRVMANYVVIVLCRISPSLRLKNWLLRRIGVDVGTGAVWALESMPDTFWPELITVGDDAIVGYQATILCHEFLQSEYRTGEVVVGERAMIGAGAIVLPGVEIGPDAQVAANSLVTGDVPPETTVAGVPAEPVDDPGE